MIAQFFGVDPYAVDHLWPLDLRTRAEAFVEIYSKPRKPPK